MIHIRHEIIKYVIAANFWRIDSNSSTIRREIIRKWINYLFAAKILAANFYDFAVSFLIFRRYFWCLNKLQNLTNSPLITCISQMLFVTCKKWPGPWPEPELDRGLREGGWTTHLQTFPIIYIDAIGSCIHKLMKLK